ncbi:MAG: hypothetical protein ACO1QR_00505 [Chthoniobacteraceae bacterium]
MNSRAIFLVLSVVIASAAPMSAQDGAIKATTTAHPDGTQSDTIFDPEKRTAEETTRTKAGKVLRKITYLLDDQNQPLGSMTYDAKGTLQFRASYKRDGMGRIDEETISNPNGQLIRRRVYTYGANNKVIKLEEFDANGNRVEKRPTTNQSRGIPDKKKNRR